ncbi:unnamed protein product [Rodentolepis nana]|uniref:AT-rich interactive domain-containing protein 1B-like n=1 Tax=Rodentolepis nana TaxID=102285 RepID=A0A0R3THB4_RODNA|nr:unnamed protein product [Rodentolepis nana]
MSHYPNSMGFNQNPNQQPGFSPPQISTYPPMGSPGVHANQSGQMNFPAQGGQAGFVNPGQMGYPQGPTAPPSYGNASYYPADGGGFLGPNSGMSQNHLAPTVFLPCTPPPNQYPNTPNQGNMNPYGHPGSSGYNTNPGTSQCYPPQGGRPCKLLVQTVHRKCGIAFINASLLVTSIN